MLQKKPWLEPELERRGPEKRPSVRRREWIDWGAPLACCCGVDDASVARPRRLFRARRVTSFTAARLVVFIWKATTTQAWRGHGDCSVHGAPLHGRMVILNQTQRKLLPVDHNGLNDGQHHKKKRKTEKMATFLNKARRGLLLRFARSASSWRWTTASYPRRPP
jgi:hypothetical protein